MYKRFKRFAGLLLALVTVLALAAVWTPVAADDYGASLADKITAVEGKIDAGEFDGLTPAEMGELLVNLEIAKALVASEEELTQALATVRGEMTASDAALQGAIESPRPVLEGEFVCSVKTIMAKIGKLQVIPYTWSGAGAPTFATSNANVCNVGVDGRIIPMKAGMAIITITAPNGQKYMLTVTVSA